MKEYKPNLPVKSEVSYEQSIEARCPSCNRNESFQQKAIARAWLTGHILEEHDDEMPELSGVVTDEDK